MGVISGTMSFKAYYVEGYNGIGFDPLIWGIKLKREQFTPLQKETGEKESSGFVEYKDIFSGELRTEKIFVEDYAHLSFRKDVIKLQKKVLFQFIKKLEEQYKEEQDSKAKYNKIKKEAEYQYLQQTIPSIYTYEILWNTSKGVLYFFNSSKGINEQFVAAFEKAMELTLIEVETGTIAAKILSEKELERFDSLQPSELVSLS
ncbi:hypothetical protein JXR93_10315 [bacterium]|nr:hypothetical protein [bacterium]